MQVSIEKEMLNLNQKLNNLNANDFDLLNELTKQYILFSLGLSLFSLEASLKKHRKTMN